MLQLFVLLFTLVQASTPVSLDNQTTDSKKLYVEIENIRDYSGQKMKIAVYKKEDFLNEEKPFRYAIISANSGKISEVFKLPEGEYAVAIHHDINGNGTMDKSFFGSPSEPYGFSRNYKPVFRAPRFDEVKVHLSTDRKVTISLIQP